MATHAQINFITHSASIHIDDYGLITCFKHNRSHTTCDLETFESQEAASEYIITPLPNTIYYVDVEN